MSKSRELLPSSDELAIACTQAQEGDPRLLLELYHYHASHVVRNVFRQKVPYELPLDDLVQQIAMRLAQHRGSKSFDSVEMFQAYCIRIGHNILKDVFKRQYRDQKYIGDSLDDDQSPVRRSAIVDETEPIDPRLGMVLGSLNPRQRQTLVLTVSGYDGAEAAEKMGIRPGNFRFLTFRLRRFIAEKLNEPDTNL